MAGHGGARNRSGPTANPASARSDARDVRAKRLQVGGYVGDFPPIADLLPDATEREGEVWAGLWRTPQASQWILEEWRWRTVAMYVRWLVKAEAPDAKAVAITAAQRLADQIGMTPAGLKENGWLIVSDLAPDHQDQQEKHGAAKRGTSRTNGGGKRMTAVRGRRD
ncbi:hypothetical protein [Gordonia sp. NB41Y]|uniref:hypothetical protein n=1 Tax=Gordonia sp. NB41Y TaxID=875808 RepID=UPI0002BD76E0|nr:hypothetical protein [Gordonia sp. NB41Y]EMP15048.1 hypothetical protein ISGA_37 [Gordonia sp. NB41Y]WLP91332.1 hypothetical protein Q9K23_03410 [Gordonia sp. NB41Y]